MTYPTTYWNRGRDKYGRSRHDLVRDGRTVGRIAKMPRSWTDSRPGQNYLANDWTLADRDPAKTVTYHATLKSAKARIEAAA